MRFPAVIRRAVLLAAAACMAACSGLNRPDAAAPAAAQAEQHPRLVVLLVVDGLPQRQVLQLRDQYGPDGLARLLDRGAWWSQVRYPYAFTVTAAGHAALATGATPARTGIVGNNWLDPQTGANVYNTADAQHRYIGHPTQAGDGTSPRNLLVPTLGDVLREREPQAKVLAVSGKDRGAILPAGQRGVAYMYQASTGQFASTTYYMDRHPAWVEAFHAGKPADRWLGQRWEPLLPDTAYARSLPDNQPWYAGRLKQLPLALPTAGPAYYGALLSSPFADQLTLDFALAAVRGEQLGQDEVPDLLAISLSGHDYVNHATSAESRFSQDHLLQLDRQLQAFFQALDAQVGAGRWVAALSADHGFTRAPEVARAAGGDAGRLDFAPVLARVNAGLAQSFGGAAPLVRGTPASGLLVDRALAARLGLSVEAVAQQARVLLLQEPAIAAAATASELQSGARAGEPLVTAMRRGWHPQRSGDVQYVLRQGWMVAAAGSTHGSPWDEDTRVPLLLWGPPWVRPGRIDTPATPLDLAPTLATLLRIPPPPAAEGRALQLP